MEKKIRLNIVTNDNKNINENIISIITETIDGKVEILSNHAKAIISTIPTVTIFIDESGGKKKIFTSSGILYINSNLIMFCCDSADFPEEIDLERAERAKERAEKRLANKNDIDIERAKKALLRAKARIELKKCI